MNARVFDLPPASQTRSRATRDRFVEAALNLLAHRAWEEVTVQDIIDASNLSVGAFYKRFRAKDDVLAAAIENALERGRAEAERLFSIEGNLAVRVRALVETLVRGWSAHALILRGALALKSTAHIEALRAERVHARERLAAWLLVRRSEFGHPDPEAAISTAIALPLAALQADTAAAPADTEGRRVLVEETVRMLIAYFCSAVRDCAPQQAISLSSSRDAE